jgi:hypothetical protein
MANVCSYTILIRHQEAVHPAAIHEALPHPPEAKEEEAKVSSNLQTKRFAYLDVTILNALQGGPKNFMQLSHNVRVEDEARRAGARSGQEFRMVDRRLQALRKAGKLKVTRATGWELA